jgi:signal transduction histidine kinase
MMIVGTRNSQRGPTAERAPRLVLRFAVYSGIVLAVAGLAILWLVDRQVANRAERTVEHQAQVVAEENLKHQLRASDFVAPVSGGRRAALDELFRRRVLIPGVVGARLVNRHGTITYAARHQLIGTRVAYNSELRDVFAGVSTRRVTRTATWQGARNVKVLQALVPVRRAASSEPIGALELDQDYRAVDVSVNDARGRLALILAIAFLVLYLALFPILRRVTSELAARNRGLAERAKERERLFDAERIARAEAESTQRLLAEQNDRLRELDRMKDEFVSLVSHELRTPLTSIRGYVELMLEEDALNAEQAQFLGIVDRNSRRLLELVGDLLFLAQVDAGRLELELENVELDEVVGESIEAARPLAESRQLELVTSVAPVPRVVGDRARLAQVLDNLVSNAIKFTPEGGRVRVVVGVEEGNAVVTVKDTGLGIPRAEQTRLFERFFRSSRATENAIPGTGLGLTITKAIVERHGGRISVSSEENEGTTARVEIPLASPVGAGVGPRELAA